MPPALAAQRATDVLRYVTQHPGERLTLTDLSDRLSVGRAAMHGVLKVLVDSGFLEQKGPNKLYRLGPEAVVLGSAARAQDALVGAAASVAREFAERHRVCTSVLVRREHELLVLDSAGTRPEASDFSLPGRRVLFGAPNGTVFLAWSPPHDVVAWLQRGGVDPAGPEAEDLHRELDEVRARGWAFSKIGPGASLNTLVAPVLVAERPSDLALVATQADDSQSVCDVYELGAELAEATQRIA